MRKVVRRKKRFLLPGLKVLPVKPVNISSVQVALRELLTKKDWHGLSNEYIDLCENHPSLPEAFKLTGQSNIYSQIALTSFDDNFHLNDRKEKSLTFWDRKIVKNNPKADERFYRKLSSDLPDVFKNIIKIFYPHCHRVRIAKLSAFSKISEHIDYDTDYSIRVHLPILTNPKCFNGFYDSNKCRKKYHLPADGQFWFVNQGYKHWAENNGSSDRIHLVMSVDSQTFL